MYKKENGRDLMQKWVEGESNHGVLQDFKEKYSVSYYDVLQCNNAFLTRATVDSSCETVRQQNESKRSS